MSQIINEIPGIRIHLDDSIQEILFKVSEGNPGALRVLTRILAEGPAIDPQSFSGGLSAILSLDCLGIYGSKIWQLYKDVCGESIVNLLVIVRACQLGFLSQFSVSKAIENGGADLDIAEILRIVKKQLVEFDRPRVKPEADQ